MVKKIILAVIGLSFAFAISSCKMQKKRIYRAKEPVTYFIKEERPARHRERW